MRTPLFHKFGTAVLGLVLVLQASPALAQLNSYYPYLFAEPQVLGDANVTFSGGDITSVTSITQTTGASVNIFTIYGTPGQALLNVVSNAQEQTGLSLITETRQRIMDIIGNRQATVTASGVVYHDVIYTLSGNRNGATAFTGQITIAQTPAASLTVTSPTAGETWRKGETKIIRWTYPTEYARYLRYIKAYYIPTGAPIGVESELTLLGDGQYSWTIPNDWPVTGQFKIRVGVQPEGASTMFADSAEFTLAPASPGGMCEHANPPPGCSWQGPETFPTCEARLVCTPVSGLTVTSPTTGETWRTGQAYEIRWNSSDPTPVAGNVSITVKGPRPACLDSEPACMIAERSPYVIAESAPDTGSYTWMIPGSFPDSYRGAAQVTVARLEPRVVGRSGAFTITNAPSTSPINVLAPNGGEQLTNQSIYNITWSDSGRPNNCPVGSNDCNYTVFVMGANGGLYGSVSNELITTKSFSWTVGKVWVADQKVQLLSGSDYVVQVQRGSGSTFVSDKSNSPFSIVLATTLNQPPVITGGTAPSTLRVGEEGTWSINAYDPEQGYLSYSVNWGDNVPTPMAGKSNLSPTQAATFTHSYANAGTYTVVITVTDDKGASARSSYTVNVTGIQPPTPAVRVDYLKAPQSGYYAFKMNWYRSTASSAMFLLTGDYNSINVLGTAGIAQLTLDVPVASNLVHDRYLVVGRGDTTSGANFEVIDIDWSTSSGSNLVLRSPLQNSYHNAFISRYMGGYWGYCPANTGILKDIGYYSQNSDIAIGYMTNYNNEIVGPKDTLPGLNFGSKDYFYITQPEQNRYRVWLDEGKHIGWTNRDNRLGYNDGSFDIVFVGQSPAANNPMPLPVHSASGPEYCGTENVVPTTKLAPAVPQPIVRPVFTPTEIKNDATQVVDGKSQNYSGVDAAKAKEVLNRAETIINKIKALQNELKALTPELASIKDFIAFGTPSTTSLGEGERAGVVASFAEAFGKAPSTDAEWEDVIKIANGRWPTLRSESKEDKAEAAFKQIYKRTPDRDESKFDDAAITIMAYGLRPNSRNTESEKAAIKSFKAIYGRTPASATDWDTVRAIAYSGASRELKKTNTSLK